MPISRGRNRRRYSVASVNTAFVLTPTLVYILGFGGRACVRANTTEGKAQGVGSIGIWPDFNLRLHSSALSPPLNPSSKLPMKYFYRLSAGAAVRGMHFFTIGKLAFSFGRHFFTTPYREGKYYDGIGSWMCLSRRFCYTRVDLHGHLQRLSIRPLCVWNQFAYWLIYNKLHFDQLIN